MQAEFRILVLEELVRIMVFIECYYNKIPYICNSNTRCGAYLRADILHFK